MTDLHTDTEVVKKVMDLAKKQFQAQKYTDCLRLYTRAIAYVESMNQSQIGKLRVAYGLNERPSYCEKDDKIYHPKLATLLDNRAAVLEKLKRYGDAQSDAKDMVRIEPYNARGWLRLGKLLQIQKQDETALKIYEKGIAAIETGIKKFKMRVNEHLFTNLRDQKDLLQKKLTEPVRKVRVRSCTPDESLKRASKRVKLEPKASDPFVLFPAELILTIMQNLPMKSILRCRQVCKQWNDIITRLPLYNEITMMPYSGTRELNNCYQLVIKSKAHMERKSINKLQMSSIKPGEEKQLINLMLARSKIYILGHLELTFGGVTMQQLTEFIKTSENAQEVLSQLRSLRITCVFTPTYEFQLLNLLPSLQTLMIIPAQSKRPALPKEFTPPTEPFTNLKSLTIIGDITKKYPSLPFHHFFTEQGARLLPNLNTLVIVGYDFTDLNRANGTYNFLLNFPRLHTLVFENNSGFNFRTMLQSHDILQLNRLKKFAMREREIRYIEGLQLYLPEYLTNVFGGLVHLDLTGSCISFQGLHKILQICGLNLKKLYIGFCPNITFRRGPFSNGVPQGGYFDFNEFVRLCPCLESLFLNQATDLGDFAMTEWCKAIEKFDGMRMLKVLDLSFDTSISGYKLLEFLKLRSLEVLILHGVDIKVSTLTMIQRLYCKRLESQLDKAYWKQYGVNSYNPF